MPLVGSYFGLIVPGFFIISQLVIIGVKRPYLRMADDIRVIVNLLISLSIIGVIGYLSSLSSESLQIDPFSFYGPVAILGLLAVLAVYNFVLLLIFIKQNQAKVDDKEEI